MFYRQAIFFCLSLSSILVSNYPVKGQLLPDNTLREESSVINRINSLEDRIDGGAIRGSNLFHSFKEFNIESARSVYFNNPIEILNILTRVTGNNQSQILGKLGVLGNANLFLINPNGIIFGKDASLDINGSFVGSTASFINFADGTQFSAVSSEDKPLLTINTPIGLGMGKNPGEIRVNGDGHKLFTNRFGFPFKDSGTKALEINSGSTIALIGGNIIFNGGSIKTNSGKIELGSVGSGNVDFTFTPQSLQFSYEGVDTFQDIRLSNESSLQVLSLSTTPKIESNLIDAGSIYLRGKTVSLEDGSLITIENQKELPSGGININAIESLEFSGFNITENQFSGIQSQASSIGKGGDIKVDTKQLLMEDGGTISAYNFGQNGGGNIEIKASNDVEIIGTGTIRTSPTRIATNTFNSGDGGSINISTSRLLSAEGSTLSSSTFASGNAGNLTIDASESIKVIGTQPLSTQTSILTSLTLGSGNSGDLTLNTQTLIIKDGGRVDASTFNNGAAGSITINAFEKVELTGYATELFIPSQITSSAEIASQGLQRVFGIPLTLTGESGAITINTNQLNITDNASLAVKNNGTGNAGRLTVKANSININHQGNISAATALGEGGEIDLQTQNLLLRNNSNISATSDGEQNGGNIFINTQVLTALENSDITANSEGRFGGRIEINAKGIFGTQFREFITPESDITASSGLGTEFNGVVDINTIAITPNSGLVELPNNLTNSSKQIVSGCSATQGNKFIISGRGGLPESPNQLFTANTTMVDLIDLVTVSENLKSPVTSTSSIKNKKEIVEAQGWIVTAEGNIEFVAEVPEVIPNNGGISQANCQVQSSS